MAFFIINKTIKNTLSICLQNTEKIKKIKQYKINNKNWSNRKQLNGEREQLTKSLFLQE